MSRAWLALVLVFGLGLGCTPAPELVVVSTRELGPLVTVEGVELRERGYSLFGFGRSVWLFGDTRLSSPDADGETLRSNGWSHTPDLGAKDGVDLFETPSDAAGGPAPLFSLTAEELAFEQANADSGARVVLWPLTGVRDDQNDRVLVFYAKLAASGAGAGELTRIGSSVAVWTDLDYGPIRPVLDAGAAEPTLLFLEPEPQWGQAALVVGDQLYAYACSEDVYHPCKLARVELDGVFERDRWEFWTGREWSAEASEAVALLEADTVLTVTRNFEVSRYLAFYGGRESGELLVRAAEQPEGPWSEPTVVFTAEAAIADVLAHPEYRRGGGQFELLSFRVETQTRLLEVELAPGE